MTPTRQYLLKVLQHYAPNGTAQQKCAELLWHAEMNYSSDSVIDSILVGALNEGLNGAGWFWDGHSIPGQVLPEPVLKPRLEKGPNGDPALQRPYVRRDIGKHIASAFADKPVGTMLTIAEIVAHRSEEYGGQVGPASGAVVSRLFPSQDGNLCTVPGVKGTMIADSRVEGGLKRGAVKVA